MKPRTFAIVLIAFALLAIGVMALRGGGDGTLADWLRSMHGR